jgi:hypothetical protein
MRRLGVEDMIVEGTDCGKPIKELLFQTPDRFQIVCEIQNEQVEERKKSFLDKYKALVNECPWLGYWWMQKDVPTARECSPDPITKRRRNYRVPTEEEFITILNLLPLGHEGIFHREEIVQAKEEDHEEDEGTVDEEIDVGPRMRVRSAQSIARYPDVQDAPPVETEEPFAEVLSVTVFDDFATELSELQIELLSWNYAKEKVEIDSGRRTLESYVISLSNKNQNKIQSLFISRVKTHKEVSENLKSKYGICASVFAKIGTANMKSVLRELDAFDFHAAYKKIENMYVTKGIANPEDFETTAKSIYLQPGQSINDHWNLLSEAIKRWATVLGLLQDLKSHSEEDDEETYIPVCNREEAEANSGELEDYQVLQRGYVVHISESARYRILNNSLSKYTDRFKTVKDIMSALPLKKRFIKNYLEQLRIREDDQAGQDDLAEEVNHLCKDESNSKRAMNASVKNSSKSSKSNNDPTRKIYPQGSCKYHPLSTSHTTNECNGGKSKDIPNIIPCKWCTINKPKIAGSHTSNKCFFDPESPNYNKGNQNKTSANLIERETKSKNTSPKKNSKKRKPDEEAQMTRKDFTSKKAYNKFTNNQNKMSEFLDRVTIDNDDNDSSDD